MTTATIIGSAMLLIILGVSTIYLALVTAPLVRDSWRDHPRTLAASLGLVAWVGVGTMLLLVGR